MGVKWQFYHWHLEPSAVCALQCPRCPRTEHPDTPWLNYNMDLNFVQSFLTPDMIKNHVKRITMCGDVGDPIYCPEYLEIYEYIKSVDPTVHIVTITNGSHKKIKWWEQFAKIANEYDSVNFSIDGYNNESNNLYRVNSKWNTIIDGITTIRELNQHVFLNWALIVFKFNQEYLQQIQEYAKQLGMDSLQITKSTKFGSKYGNAYGDVNDQLEPDSQWISDTHRYQRHTIDLSGRRQNINDYLKHNRIKFNEVRDRYKDSAIIPLCEIGNRGLYVNAEGVVFPCSWTSFPYTALSNENKTIKWQDSFFAMHRDLMNLRNRTLDQILNDKLWTCCSKGWTDSTKTWVECSTKCSADIVDEMYAVGWETN